MSATQTHVPPVGRHHARITSVVDLMVHPLAVASVIGLIVNDHWAKRHMPSWVTGKASDALGSVVLTTLGIAITVVVAQRAGRAIALDRRLVAVVAGVVTTAVAIVKTSAVGATVGGALLGVAAWPLELLGALLSGRALPGPGVAYIVIDPYDAVVALAGFVLIALVPAKRPEEQQTCTTARRCP